MKNSIKLGLAGLVLAGSSIFGCANPKDNFETRLYSLARQEYRQSGRSGDINEAVKNTDLYRTYSRINLSNLSQEQKDYLGKFNKFPLNISRYFDENRDSLTETDKAVRAIAERLSEKKLIDKKKITEKELLLLLEYANFEGQLRGISVLP